MKNKKKKDNMFFYFVLLIVNWCITYLAGKGWYSFSNDLDGTLFLTTGIAFMLFISQAMIMILKEDKDHEKD